jgi:hypothetical protein
MAVGMGEAVTQPCSIPPAWQAALPASSLSSALAAPWPSLIEVLRQRRKAGD